MFFFCVCGGIDRSLCTLLCCSERSMIILKTVVYIYLTEASQLLRSYYAISLHILMFFDKEVYDNLQKPHSS